MKFYLKDEGPEDMMEIDLSKYPSAKHITCKEEIGLFVDDVAEFLFNERDGWEWMPDKSTEVIILDDNGKEYKYSIATEYSPDFYCELKE